MFTNMFIFIILRTTSSEECIKRCKKISSKEKERVYLNILLLKCAKYWLILNSFFEVYCTKQKKMLFLLLLRSETEKEVTNDLV